MNLNTIGEDIYKLAHRLWPLNRSITGNGVRETLSIVKEYLPSLEIFEVPTGTKVFDWTIPREWKVNDAYLLAPGGDKICDFKQNNLHLVGYSVAINAKLTLAELQEHLYSIPEQPTAIPYVTSYYEERWGFCLSHESRQSLQEGVYEVYIDTELFEGNLTYGELVVPGVSKEEILISTYVCHPSMANNELTGPCVSTYVAKTVLERTRRYTYRFVFVPETIGSITFISRNIDHLKRTVIAGFNLSCLGDDKNYSYLPSRNGQTLSDVVAKHVLKHLCSNYQVYSWRDRGSDEQQYCAPGVDLPVASIMRSKYGTYSEYHTHLDDLISVVTPNGLKGGFTAVWRAIEAVENNCQPKVTVLCEPHLSKRGLYNSLSTRSSSPVLIRDLISWADGAHSLIEIAELCECPVWELYEIVETLSKEGLLECTT